LENGDVVVVTSKIVSKAYGFLVKLDEINPSKRALKIAEKSGGDPRFIQAVLDNTTRYFSCFHSQRWSRRTLLAWKNCPRTFLEPTWP